MGILVTESASRLSWFVEARLVEKFASANLATMLRKIESEIRFCKVGSQAARKLT